MSEQYRVHEVNVDDKNAWNECIYNLNLSVYFTHEYATIIKDNYNSDINILKMSNSTDGVILIYTKRSKIEPYQDIYSPYGMDGIFLWGDNQIETILNLNNYLKTKNFITYYQQTHPSYNFDTSLISSSRTVYVLNIQSHLQIIWNKLHNNHRYEISKIEKSNFNIIHDTHELSLSINKLYTSTLNRVNANEIYYFKNESLIKLISSPISYSIGIKTDCDIDCILIFLIKDNWAEYYINASSDKGRSFTRFLIWQSIQHLKQIGIQYINLGGGVRDQDDLENFKKRFGGERANLNTINGITCKSEYQNLCNLFDIDTESNYFPPYWKNNIKE